MGMVSDVWLQKHLRRHRDTIDAAAKESRRLRSLGFEQLPEPYDDDHEAALEAGGVRRISSTARLLREADLGHLVVRVGSYVLINSDTPPDSPGVYERTWVPKWAILILKHAGVALPFLEYELELARRCAADPDVGATLALLDDRVAKDEVDPKAIAEYIASVVDY